MTDSPRANATAHGEPAVLDLRQRRIPARTTGAESHLVRQLLDHRQPHLHHDAIADPNSKEAARLEAESTSWRTLAQKVAGGRKFAPGVDEKCGGEMKGESPHLGELGGRGDEIVGRQELREGHRLRDQPRRVFSAPCGQ